MLRLIFLSCLLVLSSGVFAFPFTETDAFSNGDGLAIHDQEQNLIWLDFGVNNGKSINSVISELESTYKDWRLPTEDEVYSLWAKIVEENEDGQFWSVFDTWGANKRPSDQLPFLSWGYFIDNDGYLGAGIIAEKNLGQYELSLAQGYYSNSYVEAYVQKKVVDRKYDGSNYYPFITEGAAEISTLLVRKSTVAEPSLLGLFLIAFVVFFVYLRLKIFGKLKLFFHAFSVLLQR
jgi:hypothetical protein